MLIILDFGDKDTKYVKAREIHIKDPNCHPYGNGYLELKVSNLQLKLLNSYIVAAKITGRTYTPRTVW